jgi:multidrug efflux pump subunit AcrA (membrane-fusion protein)
MRRAFGLFVFVAAVAAVTWFGWRSRDRMLALLPGEPTVPAPVATAAARPFPPTHLVTALGRIRPGKGVVHISGPARFAVVVAELKVDVGSWVEAGDVIAVLDAVGPEQAAASALEAELELAEIELARGQRMAGQELTTQAELDRLRAHRDIIRAQLASAQAELALSFVRSPQAGRVLAVHARAGERVGEDGIVEVADTRHMYAVAEVYEDDISRVTRGMRARVTSPALPDALEGTVERVGLKVGRKTVLDSDPVADADSRVVEVEVLLDRPEAADRLTNLRVEVAISTREPAP